MNISFHRHSSDSDSCSTDSDKTWGGLGAFEYSHKGLPHFLLHAAEQVMRGGHFGAGCTSTVESSHKHFIKAASKYSRTYASHNKSQEHMLSWVLRQKLWKEVVNLNLKTISGMTPAASLTNSVTDDDDYEMKLIEPMTYTDNWTTAVRNWGQQYKSWGNIFISKQVLITRSEFLTLVSYKLGVKPLSKNINKLRKALTIKCYGVLRTMKHSRSRQFIGLSRNISGRQDFVRLRGISKREKGQDEDVPEHRLAVQVSTTH